MHYARKSGHDYHEGYYFITINTAPRRNCLSQIVTGKVVLTPIGEVVLKSYLKMAADSPEIDLRVCAIMPDHFHAIIVFRRRSEHPLGRHIRRFKARLAESKTLVLSGFPESVPATPINYENCHLNNDWARQIAGAGGDKSPRS